MKKPRAKLSIDIAAEVRRSRESTSELARRLRVNRSMISRIRNYKAWEAA